MEIRTIELDLKLTIDVVIKKGKIEHKSKMGPFLLHLGESFSVLKSYIHNSFGNILSLNGIETKREMKIDSFKYYYQSSSYIIKKIDFNCFVEVVSDGMNTARIVWSDGNGNTFPFCDKLLLEVEI